MVEAGELDVEIKEFLVFAICGAIRAVRLALPIQSCCLGFERLFPYLHHLLVYQSVEPVISWQVAHLLLLQQAFQPFHLSDLLVHGILNHLGFSTCSRRRYYPWRCSVGQAIGCLEAVYPAALPTLVQRVVVVEEGYRRATKGHGVEIRVGIFGRRQIPYCDGYLGRGGEVRIRDG